MNDNEGGSPKKITIPSNFNAPENNRPQNELNAPLPINIRDTLKNTNEPSSLKSIVSENVPSEDKWSNKFSLLHIDDFSTETTEDISNNTLLPTEIKKEENNNISQDNSLKQSFQNDQKTKQIQIAKDDSPTSSNEELGKEKENLGWKYYRGEGVTKDIKKAIEFFIEGADLGNSDAMYALGRIYLLGEHGIEKDPNKALQYYQAAEKYNHCEAIYMLGYLYSRGEVVSRDIKKAMKYYKKSGEFGYVPAFTNLAYIYMYEEGHQNVQLALNFFETAANLNDEKALCNLGVIYLMGEDKIEKNPIKALKCELRAKFVFQNKGSYRELPKDMNHKSLKGPNFASDLNTCFFLKPVKERFNGLACS